MSAPEKNADWGPSHQTDRRKGQGIGRAWFRRPIQGLVIAWLFGVFSSGVLVGLVIAWCITALVIKARFQAGKDRDSPATRVLHADDRLAAVHAEAGRAGGGTYLGIDGTGRWQLTGRERAVLILGPPRSGKSSTVMIPALLAHPGAAVSVSTKQ
jgi:hypothetical protein